MTRKPEPTDVSGEEWAFVAPYLTLISEDAPQREHRWREVFNGLRWMVRAGNGLTVKEGVCSLAEALSSGTAASVGCRVSGDWHGTMNG